MYPSRYVTSARPRRCPRRLHVPRDLLDELVLARERLLVAQPPPELDHEPLTVLIALPVEQEGLDPPLVAAVVGIDADRDRRADVRDRPRVDAVRRHCELRPHVEVGGREAEPRAAVISADDDALDLEGPPEQARRLGHLARLREGADSRGRDSLDERHRAHVEPERREQPEVAGPPAPEAESGACRHDLRPDRQQVVAHERLRLELGHRGRERHDQDLVEPAAGQELDPPLKAREQGNRLPEDGARMRVEGDPGRHQPRVDRGAHHRPVAEVDAVEGTDRHRPTPPTEVGRSPRDLHAAVPAPWPFASASTPAATAAGTRRSASPGSRASASWTGSRLGAAAGGGGTASSTANGPTAVRRSARQCPPSAVAIART